MNDSSKIPNTPVFEVISPSQIVEEMESFTWKRPQRITPTLHPVLPCPVHHLPLCIQGYVKDSANRMNAPADFAAVASLVAIGTATRGKIQIRPKQQDHWSEFPNLWGLGIGSPSVMKSPSTSEMFKVLSKIEKDYAAEYRSQIKDWEIKGKLLNLTLSGIEKRMKAGDAGLVVAGAAIKATKFAEGGIVKAPTFAMFGEYPGAFTNPEIAGRFDQFKGMLQPLFSNAVDAGRLIGNIPNRTSSQPIHIHVEQNEFGAWQAYNRADRAVGRLG